jgi:hypothetical protein
MGYSTDFTGSIKIDPPLNQSEIDYLIKFSWTRHMKRQQGPYFVVDDMNNCEDATGVINFNEPHTPQPSLWCNFTPTKDGTELIWNECEKTYEGDKWIKYLIDYFLKPKAKTHNVESPNFRNFTYNHICNGELYAQGEDPKDVWKIVVKDNVVTVKRGKVVYD